MSNAKISGMTAAGALAANDLLEISQTTGGPTTKSITGANIASMVLASPAMTGTPTAPTASAGTNNTQVATTAYVDGKIKGFSAHKNGTDQTGIASSTATKITFGTTVYNDGALFDSTTNYRWTPPAGRVVLQAAAYIQNLTVGSTAILSIYKNGSRFKIIDRIDSPDTSTFQFNGSISDQANGTDYYELWINGFSGSTLTAFGAADHTWFMGTIV